MRYYDPVGGRFISRDPLGLWGDANQKGNGQGYCGHDPINLIDPHGLGDKPTTDELVRLAERAFSEHPEDDAAAAREVLRQYQRAGQTPEDLAEFMDELTELEKREARVQELQAKLDDAERIANDPMRRADIPDNELPGKRGMVNQARRRLTEQRRVLTEAGQRMSQWAKRLALAADLLDKAKRKMGFVRRVLGPFGIILAVFLFPSKVEAKEGSVVGALADEALDSCPVVGWIKMADEELNGGVWVGTQTRTPPPPLPQKGGDRSGGWVMTPH